MTSKVKILSLSDIHLGHRIVNAALIIKALKNELGDLSEADVIFLCGDIFDIGLNLYDACVIDIQQWIRWLLKQCAKHNVKLKVLEGTPSHDRKQSKQFVILNETLGNKADLDYVTELCIKRDEELGFNILYVPDEWANTCADTYQQVLALMAEAGLKEVDFAIMHGNFKYQIPAIGHLDAHIEKNYLDIVKHYVFIGHVHTMSRYKKILAQGSFHRLKHGEEEKKGFLSLVMEEGKPDLITFHENKLATIFKTIDLRSLEADDCIVKINEAIEKYGEESNLRLQYANDSVIKGICSSFKRSYPFIRWSDLVETVKVDKEDVKETIGLEVVVINERTLPDLISDKFKENGVNAEEAKLALALVNDCTQGV